MELRGVKVAQFSDFGLFSPYKTPKTYLPVTSLQPRGYIAEWLQFFHVVVEGPRGAFRPRCFPATSGRGAGYPQTCPNFPYGKSLYQCRMLLHCASDLDQRCLKMRNSENGCTFPTNIFAPTPKITPKPHFGGPFKFNTKPIIHGALRKSHVNGATKLKLYSYIGNV